jgi:hypothetical protein
MTWCVVIDDMVWLLMTWCVVIDDMVWLQAGGNVIPREADQMIRLPFLRTWFRTRSAIVLHLSNGTMQVSSSILNPLPLHLLTPYIFFVIPPK